MEDYNMKKGLVALFLASTISLMALSGCHAMWERGFSDQGKSHEARVACAQKCEKELTSVECKRCDDKLRVAKYKGIDEQYPYAMGTRYSTMFGGY